MMKFVTVAYLCLLIGQAVCDLECYKCWNCKEKEENWDKCAEDTIPPDSSVPTTTMSPTTTITPTTSSTTTVPSYSAETSTNSETTTSIILESSTIKATSQIHEKPDGRTNTSLPIFKVILGMSAKVETKQHKCAFIKYKDENDNDIIDRFCTMKENCKNIRKTSYAGKKIICDVCETNLCNKDEPGSGRSIHRGTFTTVFVVAISKTLFFN